MRRVLVASVIAAALVAAPATHYTTAKRKIEAIQQDRLPAGSKIVFTPAELNAYASTEVHKVVPQGVRDPRVELRQGAATAFAYVDFAKVRAAAGSEEPGWLTMKLLSGERPVRVDARIISGGGALQVDVERVDISGVSITGSTLDYMIRNFLQAYYPDAQVNRSFDLAHRMQKIDVAPSGATVVIGK